MLIQDYIPAGRPNRPGTKMIPQYITVHDTANPNADAKNHANFLKNTDKKVSWHYTVDDVLAVQHIPIHEVAYHAGCKQGNMTSIGVEICEFTDPARRAKAEANAIELIRQLVSLTGAKVVQHYYWTKKNCPRVIRARNGWDEFLKKIEVKKLDTKTDIIRSCGVVVQKLAVGEDITAQINYLEKLFDAYRKGE